MGATAGASAGSAAAAAIAQAIKASGVIVSLEPQEFQRVLYEAERPLVVVREPTGAVFSSSKWEYLFSYKGLAFHTKSAERLHLPGGCEVVASKKIWVP